MSKAYNIKMQTEGKTAEILVYSTIYGGDWYISEFLYDLAKIVEDKPDKIELRIHCGGGSVFNTYAMVTSLKATGIPIDCYIDGVCASAASILMLCARKIYMAKLSMLMIHNPTSSVEGEAKDMIAAAELLQQIEELSIQAYKERTGLSEEELKAMMGKTTWMTPQKALSLKFIDGIVEAKYVIPEDAITEEDIEKICEEEDDCEQIMQHFKISEYMADNTKTKPPIAQNPPANGNDVWVEMHKDSLALYLQLKNNREDKEVVEQIQQVLNKEKHYLEKISNLEAEIARMKASEFEDTIQMAIEQERITEAEAATYRKVKDINVLREVLNSRPAKLRPSQIFRNVFNANGDNKTMWTYKEWSEKDSSGLAKMEKEDPERYSELYKQEVARLRSEHGLK